MDAHVPSRAAGPPCSSARAALARARGSRPPALTFEVYTSTDARGGQVGERASIDRLPRARAGATFGSPVAGRDPSFRRAANGTEDLLRNFPQQSGLATSNAQLWFRRGQMVSDSVGTCSRPDSAGSRPTPPDPDNLFETGSSLVEFGQNNSAKIDRTRPNSG